MKEGGFFVDHSVFTATQIDPQHCHTHTHKQTHVKQQQNTQLVTGAANLAPL